MTQTQATGSGLSIYRSNCPVTGRMLYNIGMAKTNTTPNLPAPFQPNTPRPLGAVFVGARPGSDARWRGVPKKVRNMDRLRVKEMQAKKEA